MIKYLSITFTLLSMMIIQHLSNLKSKPFFITFTFWGEVRTLKNLSCNLQLWWVMRHLEALSCSTCFLVGSQTETSHTFLWPRVFCLVKSRGGGAPGSKPVNPWKYHGNLTEVSWKHREKIMDKSLRQSFLENWSSLVIIAKCFTRMSFWMEKISYPKLWPHTRWVLIRHYPEPMARMVPKLLHKPGSCWWIGWFLMVNLRMVNFDDAFVHIKTNLDFVLRKWEMFAAIWEFQRTWDGMMRFDSNNSPSMHVNPLKKVSLPHKDQNQRKTPTSIMISAM